MMTEVKLHCFSGHGSITAQIQSLVLICFDLNFWPAFGQTYKTKQKKILKIKDFIENK